LTTRIYHCFLQVLTVSVFWQLRQASGRETSAVLEQYDARRSRHRLDLLSSNATQARTEHRAFAAAWLAVARRTVNPTNLTRSGEQRRTDWFPPMFERIHSAVSVGLRNHLGKVYKLGLVTAPIGLLSQCFTKRGRWNKIGVCPPI
jgi:hypothetical protein